MGPIMDWNDDMPGAGGGAAHAAGALVRVHLGHALFQVNGVKLTCLGAVAKAQATKFADERATPRHLGGGQAVGNPLVNSFIPGRASGAPDEGNLPGHLFRLDAHDGGHSLGARIAAGDAQTHRRLTIQHRLGIRAAAGKSTAAAVCPRQGLNQPV